MNVQAEVAEDGEDRWATSHAAGRARSWRLGAVLVVVVGILLSLAGATRWESVVRRQDDEVFRSKVIDVAGRLRLTIQRTSDLLTAERAFLSVDPDLTTGKLEGWIDNMAIGARYPEMVAYLAIEPVTPEALPAFAAEVAADPSAMGQRVTPADVVDIEPTGVRPSYCLARAVVVTDSSFVGPDPGVDYCQLGTNVLTWARDSGRVHFVGLPGTEFLVAVTALYRGGSVPVAAKDRREAFTGWAGAVYDPARSLNAGLRASGREIDLRLEYQDAAVERFVVASTTDGPIEERERAVVTTGWTLIAGGETAATGLTAVAQGRGVLAAGVVLSLLLGLLFHSLASSRARALQLVAKKTDQLRFQALHDGLTGLANRVLILDRAEHMLARARRQDNKVAAMFIDLDHFKNINDTLGHAAGDQLLILVAARLRSAIRDSDTVGRLGGDEFVVLLEGSSLDAGPESVAERLLEILAEPYQLDEAGDMPLHVNGSIGIAVGNRASAGELLRDADLALYRAKEAGRGGWAIFESEMHQTVEARLRLATDLQGALEADQLYVEFQPTFDLQSGLVNGMEALVRWQHPVLGTVSPDVLIPLAEETGAILKIGRWVLGQACTQAAVWHRAGHHIRISVNVSPRQLDNDEFVADVESALAASGLAPAYLTLEIAEATLMRHAEATIERLRRLKGTGVLIAIDDFGTGYSSLGFVRRFPVDAIKIDRSFVMDIADSVGAATMVHMLVDLGRTLGLETHAEGIEDHQQLGQLQREQCDSGQGFLFARPLASTEIEGFLDETGSWRAMVEVEAADVDAAPEAAR